MTRDFDTWALGLCDYVALRSRDPSTKVGAVIARPDKTIASLGYNGFPRGVEDLGSRYTDRETKYRFVCHAEANAIVAAREPLHGATLYCTPFPPCQECAKLIIQAGIGKVVAPYPSPEQWDRWHDSFDAATTMFHEAGVTMGFRHR